MSQIVNSDGYSANAIPIPALSVLGVHAKVIMGSIQPSLFSSFLCSSRQADYSCKQLTAEACDAIVEGLKVSHTLELLNLRRTNLSERTSRTLAEALKINKTLLSLNLRGNKLEQAFGQILAVALRVNQTLQMLDLGNNRLGKKGAIALAEALPFNHTLEILDIKSNNLGEEGGIAFAKALNANGTLKSLNLANNNLREKVGIEIATELTVNHTLQVLNLADNELGGNTGYVLAGALRVNNTLTSLNLWVTGLGPQGGVHIADALIFNVVLESLNLGGNELDERAGKTLAMALQVNRTLKTLVLTMNNLGDKADITFAIAWRGNITLQRLYRRFSGLSDSFKLRVRIIDLCKRHLKLSFCGKELDAIGIKILAEELMLNRSVRSLELKGTDLGKSEVTLLAEMLEVNKTLKSLCLWKNGLDKEAGKILGKALAANQTLQHLNLGRNELGEEGGKALANGLEWNRALQSLSIWCNQLGEEAGIAIAEVLRINRTLKELDLSGNELGEKAGQAIAAALKDNNELLLLDLRANRLGKAAEKALAVALKLNAYLSLNSSLSGLQELLAPKIEESDESLTQKIKIDELCNSENPNVQGDRLNAIGVAYLIEMLATNRVWKSLHLSEINFKGARGIALAKALEVNGTLQSLILDSFSLDNAAVGALAKALEVNRSLRSLSLRWNKIGRGRDEPDELSGIMQRNGIIFDYFGESNSSKKLGVAFAETLKINQTLRMLDLSFNDLDDEAGQALAKALMLNRTLQALDLNNNRFGEKTGKAFAEALRVNHTLTSLGLNKTGLDHEAGIALAQALKVNRTLQTLNLNGNKFNNITCQEFNKALQFNHTLISFDCAQYNISNYIHIHAIAIKIEQNKKRFEQRKQEIKTKIKELVELSNTNYNSARHSLCQLTAISSTYYAEKRKALLALIKLIGNDPLHPNSACGLIESTSILIAQLNAELLQWESIEIKFLLLWAYAGILDVIMLHYALQHITPSNNFRDKLEQIRDSLAKLDERNFFVSTQISHIKEAITHLLHEGDLYEEIGSKVKEVSELLYFHQEPGRNKLLSSISQLPASPTSWYMHVLRMRQLYPAAKESLSVLCYVMATISNSTSVEYTIKGLEWLYLAAQESRPTGELAIGFIHRCTRNEFWVHLPSSDVSKIQRIARSFLSLISLNPENL